MSISDWLQSRYQGKEQSAGEIEAFVHAVTNGSVSSAQLGAWLAFVLCKGMSERETVALTKSMVASGKSLSWPSEGGVLCDKHSTGGVGDKVSLVLAPLWAKMGRRVPMLSGRGLGITGGTLDKLESIPGYKTDLSQHRLEEVLNTVGCFINGQTSELAPADKILYATRNETQTVPSIPLITASILSKKLVEGIEELVMDVKFGSGAFMQDISQAQELADSLVRVGEGAGLKVQAHLSDMSQPLGCKVGNALEVEEAIATLQGKGPKDLVDLVCKLSGDEPLARKILDSGEAFSTWNSMVEAHGGDLGLPLLGKDVSRFDWRADSSGVVTSCDAFHIGKAAFLLGAGRENSVDNIHFGVGLQLHSKVGDEVNSGDVLVSVFHVESNLDIAKNYLSQAYTIE